MVSYLAVTVILLFWLDTDLLGLVHLWQALTLGVVRIALKIRGEDFLLSTSRPQ